MNQRILKVILTAVALFACASLAFAETKSTNNDQKTTGKNVKANSTKTAVKIELVDINSASKQELMKLPQINDSYAEKIISGRPYGSKAHLQTRKILPPAIYDGVRTLVIAKQPFASVEKNKENLINKGKK